MFNNNPLKVEAAFITYLISEIGNHQKKQQQVAVAL